MTDVWHFPAADVNDYYPAICKTLMARGTETSPRGKQTKELHPTTALLLDPRQRILSSFGRVVNLPFALAEVIQIIAGQNDAQALAHYNGSIIDIQGDGPRGTPFWQESVVRFNAAYGERLRAYSTDTAMDIAVGIDQLKHVIETLKRDPDSRQASIVLSHPGFDNYLVDTVDRACNVYAHAMLRQGKLDWMQVIRSNDAIWGIPYNIIQWSHVQEWVAASLDVPMGHLFIVQDSFHVYSDKYDECRDIEPFDIYRYLEMVPLRMEASPDILEAVVETERNIRSGLNYSHDDMKRLDQRIGLYWAAVLEALQSFREFKNRNDEAALTSLPVYAEIRAPMLRMYCHYRWHRDPQKYAREINESLLEIQSYGIPNKEACKWLGIK